MRGKTFHLAMMTALVGLAAFTVQEADAHWYGLSRSQQAAVVSPDAWLKTVTTRVCLDVLRPARARRERYVGEWLP